MKKTLSFVMALLMLVSCFGMLASANTSADTVTVKGSDLWTTVTEANKNLEHTTLKYENHTTSDGGYVSVTVKVDSTTQANPTAMWFKLGEDYTANSYYVGIKYKMDITGVAADENYTPSLRIDTNWKAAENLGGVADNTWHKVAHTDKAYAWPDPSWQPGGKVSVVIGGYVNADPVTGGASPAGLVIHIEELTLFKNKTDAQNYITGEPAPQTPAPVYGGDALWQSVKNQYPTADKQETDKIKVEKVTDAAGNYVKYTAKAEMGAGSTQFKFGGITTQKPFMVLTYKLDATNGTVPNFRVYDPMRQINGVAKGASSDKVIVEADGEWHTVILDLDNYFKEEKMNGKGIWSQGTRTMLTLMVCGWNDNNTKMAVNDSLSVKQMAFFDTRAEACAYAGVSAPAADTETGYTYDADRLNTVFNANPEASWNINVSKEADNNYVTLTNSIVTGKNKWAMLKLDFAEQMNTTENKYFAIKFRYTGTGHDLVAGLQLNVQKKRGTGLNADNFNSYTNEGLVASFAETYVDGEWHTLVVDLTTVNFDNPDLVGKTWEQHDPVAVYILPWARNPANGLTMDIECLGFFTSEDAAKTFVGINVSDDNTQGGDATTGGDTTPDTTPDTAPDTTPDTNAPSTEAPEKKGCKSSVTVGTLAIVTAVTTVGAIVCKRKKEDD